MQQKNAIWDMRSKNNVCNKEEMLRKMLKPVLEKMPDSLNFYRIKALDYSHF